MDRENRRDETTGDENSKTSARTGRNARGTDSDKRTATNGNILAFLGSSHVLVQRLEVGRDDGVLEVRKARGRVVQLRRERAVR